MCKSQYFVKVKHLYCRLEVSSVHEFALNATMSCYIRNWETFLVDVHGADLSRVRRFQNARDSRSRILVASIFVSGTSLRPTSRDVIDLAGLHLHTLCNFAPLVACDHVC